MLRRTIRLPPHLRWRWSLREPRFYLARKKARWLPAKPLLIVRRDDEKSADFLNRGLGFSGLRIGKYVNGTTRSDLCSSSELARTAPPFLRMYDRHRRLRSERGRTGTRQRARETVEQANAGADSAIPNRREAH
jgi:hypothetical protein